MPDQLHQRVVAADAAAGPAALPAEEKAKGTRDALLTELARTYERLSVGSASTAPTIAFIFVVFAGGVAAALKYPGAFVIIPVFWSAWALYILTADRDSIKYSAYARLLEEKLKPYLDTEVCIWESKVAQRHTTRRPWLVAFTYAYWATPEVVAWVISIVIFFRRGQVAWAWLSLVAAVAVCTVAACAMITRNRFSDSWLAQLGVAAEKGAAEAATEHSEQDDTRDHH